MKKSHLILVSSVVLVIAVIVIGIYLLDRKNDKPVDKPQNVTSLEAYRSADKNETSIPMDGDKDFEKADIDLDKDGIKENIKVSAVTSGSGEQGGIQEVTGRLEVTGKDGTDDISFVLKPQSASGIISGIKFIDLDGDGVKDIFISIPDTGELFTTNTLFIFNYKTKKMYSFPGDKNDFSFDKFAKGFSFSYKGKGELEISNRDYAFKGVFNMKNNDNITGSEENNKKYDASRVDTTPVMLDDNSKLKLVMDKDKKVFIKMPLAIYGITNTDVIGEVELYFTVNSDFQTEFKKFSVIGYDGSNKVKIGEAGVPKGN